MSSRNLVGIISITGGQSADILPQQPVAADFAGAGDLYANVTPPATGWQIAADFQGAGGLVADASGPLQFLSADFAGAGSLVANVTQISGAQVRPPTYGAYRRLFARAAVIVGFVASTNLALTASGAGVLATGIGRMGARVSGEALTSPACFPQKPKGVSPSRRDHVDAIP